MSDLIAAQVVAYCTAHGLDPAPLLLWLACCSDLKDSPPLGDEESITGAHFYPH